MVLHLVHARPIRPLPATATKPRQDPLRPRAIQLKLTEDVLALVLQRVQHGGDSGMRIVLGPTPALYVADNPYPLHVAEEPSFASLVEGNPRGKDLQLRGTIGYKATVQPRTGGDALEKVAQALRGKGKAAEQEREGKRVVLIDTVGGYRSSSPVPRTTSSPRVSAVPSSLSRPPSRLSATPVPAPRIPPSVSSHRIGKGKVPAGMDRRLSSEGTPPSSQAGSTKGSLAPVEPVASTSAVVIAAPVSPPKRPVATTTNKGGTKGKGRVLSKATVSSDESSEEAPPPRSRRASAVVLEGSKKGVAKKREDPSTAITHDSKASSRRGSTSTVKSPAVAAAAAKRPRKVERAYSSSDDDDVDAEGEEDDEEPKPEQSSIKSLTVPKKKKKTRLEHVAVEVREGHKSSPSPSLPPTPTQVAPTPEDKPVIVNSRESYETYRSHFQNLYPDYLKTHTTLTREREALERGEKERIDTKALDKLVKRVGAQGRELQGIQDAIRKWVATIKG